MNKRIIAAGAAVVLGLGTSVAMADDSVTLTNGSTQNNNQQVWLNQQPCQNQPVADAAADASGNSAIDAGGGGAGTVGSGNALVVSATFGGRASARATNDNSANAGVAQLNSQRTRQRNTALAVKITLKNSPIVVG